MTKDKVLEAVREMPQEFDLEELIERLIFIDKVQKGMKQLDEGNTVSHDQAKNIIKSWQK
jgi:predicted transcriptional regulator